MADSRINLESVFQAIRDDRKHTIWTPCLTLQRMGIEGYPHQPKHNRLAMRTVLETLCEQGILEVRPVIHSHGVFKEVAYELDPSQAPKR